MCISIQCVQNNYILIRCMISTTVCAQFMSANTAYCSCYSTNHTNITKFIKNIAIMLINSNHIDTSYTVENIVLLCVVLCAHLSFDGD